MKASKPGTTACPGKRSRPFGVTETRERPACGPGGVRCKGGVSSLQALARNKRICRHDMYGQKKQTKSAPWPSRGRTQVTHGKSGESTDARHRGGPARNSDEGLVMRLERRGRVGQITQQSTRMGRN